MESYYDLYQFIVQNDLITFVNKTNVTNNLWESYKKDIKDYGFYSKDMTKILNLPFAYNLARYKNLVIADLYNDKYDTKGEKDCHSK